MAQAFPSPCRLTQEALSPTQLSEPATVRVALLTGGLDRHYATSLALALASKRVALDVIGSDEVDSPELRAAPNAVFFNFLKRKPENATFIEKASRFLVYYLKLIRYAASAKPKVFHILWNSKLEAFDRTLLMLYYKALGKRITLTAHNVNAGKRDSNDSMANRLTLRIQYHLTDHIFVHTEQMKRELLHDFGVQERAISVIPFGINDCVPDTGLTPAEAKQRLGIKETDRTILFFGAIRPYKGLDCLAEAFRRQAANHPEYRLIIAGEPKKGSEKYLSDIQRNLSSEHGPTVIQRIYHIPDEETELYFKAADVLALPYTHIFQSGVLFLAYSFGLPVIAADVGSFREDVLEGRTGFLCKPRDPVDLAAAIERYFESDLFKTLSGRRQGIRDYAAARHSWDLVSELTRKVYATLGGSGGSDS